MECSYGAAHLKPASAFHFPFPKGLETYLATEEGGRKQVKTVLVLLGILKLVHTLVYPESKQTLWDRLSTAQGKQLGLWGRENETWQRKEAVLNFFQAPDINPCKEAI